MHIEDIPLLNRGFQDLNPLILGSEACACGHSFGPYVREYYLIHYVCRGKGVLRNSDGVHPVGPGQIFLIYPGQVTTYTADAQEPWEYIWVGFQGALAQSLRRLNDWVIPYPLDTFPRLLQAKERTAAREEYVAGLLFSMLSYLLEQEGGPSSYEKQAADYIRANYMRRVTVEALAEMVGLDRRYLTRRFKAKMGMTVQDFLIETRMEHAAEYLRQGEPVAVAASLSGYGDAFHFSKMFKKRFGLPPQAYRQGSSQVEIPPAEGAEKG